MENSVTQLAAPLPAKMEGSGVHPFGQKRLFMGPFGAIQFQFRGVYTPDHPRNDADGLQKRSRFADILKPCEVDSFNLRSPAGTWASLGRPTTMLQLHPQGLPHHDAAAVGIALDLFLKGCLDGPSEAS